MSSSRRFTSFVRAGGGQYEAPKEMRSLQGASRDTESVESRLPPMRIARPAAASDPSESSGSRKAAKGWFDDDDDDDGNGDDGGGIANPRGAVDEEDDDPLAAFMSGVHKELAGAPSGSRNEPKPSLYDDEEPDAVDDYLKQKAKAEEEAGDDGDFVCLFFVHLNVVVVDGLRLCDVCLLRNEQSC